MDKEELTGQLEQLRAEIAGLQQADPEAKRRLDALVLRIEARVDSVDDAEHHSRLLDDLRETVAELEAAHPAATAIINRFLVTLANMGI